MSEHAKDVITAIAKLGRAHPTTAEMLKVAPFEPFFSTHAGLDAGRMDMMDNGVTRRELLLRFLMLSAVLDQGPDILGVRMLVREVTEELYRARIPFLHRPILFFQNLAKVIATVNEVNARVTGVRAEDWAAVNQSTPGRYNLFLESRQTLNYVVFRWGVPLSLPMLHEEIAQDSSQKATAVTNYLASFASAEEMSQQLKDHLLYGLGKAIGDKAAHLFAKWSVSSFDLLRRQEPSWNSLSFETPLDSNVGRVLWRTGCLLEWASVQDYESSKVIQAGEGKGALNYIRVTNMRGMAATRPLPPQVGKAYTEVCIDHLRCNKKAPRRAAIQRLLNAYLLAYGGGLGVADLDDGLMHIGTRFCFNHSDAKCEQCPIARLCAGNNKTSDLIHLYRT